HALEDCVVEPRAERNAELLGDNAQALGGAPQNSFDGRPSSRDLGSETAALVGGGSADRNQRIDIHPVRHIGRHTARRGVRMEEVALLLEVAHGIADGCRRNAEPELVGKTSRAGRLSRFDIRLNYGFQNPPLALVQTRHWHSLKYSND